LIDKQRNSFKKALDAPKHIGSIQRQQNKRKTENKERTPEEIEKTKKKPQPYHVNPEPSKKLGLLYTTVRALLLLTWLEPTLLVTKLIEHSRFLSSLFPFCLEAEAEHCPSSTKVKKSRKPFLILRKKPPSCDNTT
jgi:hypothetical protein